MGKWNNYIQVKEVKGHTYTLDRIDARHRNISADFVARHIYPHIVNSLEYAPKAIIGAIEEKFGYTIDYSKAYQAKKKVLEHRWGTYEASYHNLPSLLHTIVQINLGSYYDIWTILVWRNQASLCFNGHSWHWVPALMLSKCVDRSFA
jgi:hypothetical protein